MRIRHATGAIAQQVKRIVDAPLPPRPQVTWDRQERIEKYRRIWQVCDAFVLLFHIALCRIRTRSCIDCPSTTKSVSGEMSSPSARQCTMSSRRSASCSTGTRSEIRPFTKLRSVVKPKYYSYMPNCRIIRLLSSTHQRPTAACGAAKALSKATCSADHSRARRFFHDTSCRGCGSPSTNGRSTTVKFSTGWLSDLYESVCEDSPTDTCASK